MWGNTNCFLKGFSLSALYFLLFPSVWTLLQGGNLGGSRKGRKGCGPEHGLKVGNEQA